MSTVLHLPFNNDASISGVLLDYSPYKTPLVKSGTISLSAAQKKYGNASCLFNASGFSNEQRLQVTTDVDHFAFSGDFTIQCWLYILAIGTTYGSYVFSTTNRSDAATSGCVLRYGRSGESNVIAFRDSVSGLVSNAAPALNTWTHVAVVRSDSTIKMYVNGVAQTAIRTNSASIPSALAYIGSSSDLSSTTGICGQIDDLHIDNGTALYTENFTPAEIPYTPRPIVTTCTTDAISASAYRVPDATYSRNLAEMGSYPLYYNGRGRIAVTVAIKGAPNLPVARRVRLHEQITGNFVAETWSDAAGDYVFDYLDPAYKYYAVSFDHTGTYQGVIADQLVPEIG